MESQRLERYCTDKISHGGMGTDAARHMAHQNHASPRLPLPMVSVPRGQKISTPARMSSRTLGLWKERTGRRGRINPNQDPTCQAAWQK